MFVQHVSKELKKDGQIPDIKRHKVGSPYSYN